MGKDIILNFIQNFIEKDFTSYSYNDLQAEYYKIFKTQGIETIVFEPEVYSLLNFIRTRPVSKVTDENLATSFAGPPINDEYGFGRCNWNGRNVFYCSDGILTSLHETKNEYKIGNEFYVSSWFIDSEKIKDKLNASFIFSENSVESNFFAKHIFEKKPRYENIEQLSKLFEIATEKQYPFTALISDTILYRVNIEDPYKIKFPFIVYPSIETEKKGLNFAIHPVFVNEYMFLDSVYHIKVTEKEKNKSILELIKIGFPNEVNTIEWFNVLSVLNDYKYRIEHIKCICGKQYSHEELKNFEFKKNGNSIGLKEIVFAIVEEYQNDFVNLSESLPFPKKEKIFSREFSIIHSLKNISLIIDNIEHKQISMNISFKIPLKYIPLKKK